MPFPMFFVDNVTVIPADWLNAVNNMLSSGVGSGTVTSMSGVAANGFGVSVANPTTTPAVTITCTVNGLLKGSGNALVPAVAGTDFLAPPAGNALLKANGGRIISPEQAPSEQGFSSPPQAHSPSQPGLISQS